MSTILTKPRVEVTTTLEERLGSILINPGPAENEAGGRALKLRKSYTLTNGSGKGLDCLESPSFRKKH